MPNRMSKERPYHTAELSTTRVKCVRPQVFSPQEHAEIRTAADLGKSGKQGRGFSAPFCTPFGRFAIQADKFLSEFESSLVTISQPIRITSALHTITSS